MASNTVSPRYLSHENDEVDSSVLGSSSIRNDPYTGSHSGDLKRSAGIFILIKAILISWAILLVGMLTCMLARHAEEILADDPYLEEAERTEDHERTSLLGENTV